MLVQLLKEIDNPGEIVEYIRPYIGSVSKAKEFAHGFLAKRNQFTQAEVRSTRVVISTDVLTLL